MQFAYERDLKVVGQNQGLWVKNSYNGLNEQDLGIE